MSSDIIGNNSPPNTDKYKNSFRNIGNWKIDKVKIDEKTNVITKVEIYNYFHISDLFPILKYLKTKKFKYVADTKKYPPLWNVLLSQEGKSIHRLGRHYWSIIDSSDKLPKYHYYVHFCQVLSHRGRPILLKIYENKSIPKDFFKLELTYTRFPKGYCLPFTDWLSAMKSINEIIGKLKKKATEKGYDEDYSKKITLDDFIHQVENNTSPRDISYKQRIYQEVFN